MTATHRPECPANLFPRSCTCPPCGEGHAHFAEVAHCPCSCHAAPDQPPATAPAPSKEAESSVSDLWFQGPILTQAEVTAEALRVLSFHHGENMVGTCNCRSCAEQRGILSIVSERDTAIRERDEAREQRDDARKYASQRLSAEMKLAREQKEAQALRETMAKVGIEWAEKVAALRTRVESLEKALRDLVSKMDEVQHHEKYRQIWEVAYLHGYPYTGPDWVRETIAAKALLADQKGPEQR